jgi:hypothetical protein
MKADWQAKNLELKGEAGTLASKLDGRTYVSSVRQARGPIVRLSFYA